MDHNQIVALAPRNQVRHEVRPAAQQSRGNRQSTHPDREPASL